MLQVLEQYFGTGSVVNCLIRTPEAEVIFTLYRSLSEPLLNILMLKTGEFLLMVSRSVSKTK